MGRRRAKKGKPPGLDPEIMEDHPFSGKVGDRITLHITDVAFGGEGVGRHEGFVVFVPFVITGETVLAEIEEIHRQYARARLVEIIDPATSRVEPQCPQYTVCGGCQYQHMAYDQQLPRSAATPQPPGAQA